MLIDRDFEYLETECYYRQYRDGTGVLYPVAVRRKRNPENSISENLKKRERKDRIYKPDRKKIRSASIDLFKRKKGRCLLFITFTFAGVPDEKECAKVWEQVLHSLRETYNVDSYVWVKEFQKRGVIHYHILLNKTYIPIKKLQWTFNRICVHNKLRTSNCSVQLGRRPRVYTIERVKNYLSKYLAKGSDDKERKSVFESRCYGFSESLTLYVTYYIDYLEKLLQKYKPYKVISGVYYCIYLFNLIL